MAGILVIIAVWSGTSGSVTDFLVRSQTCLEAFIYKVYVNELIKIVAHCEYSLSTGSLKLGSPTFADDMILLTLFPTFLRLLMNKDFRYSQKWGFDYNETKSGVVTFGEHGPHHFQEKKQLVLETRR